MDGTLALAFGKDFNRFPLLKFPVASTGVPVYVSLKPSASAVSVGVYYTQLVLIASMFATMVSKLETDSLFPSHYRRSPQSVVAKGCYAVFDHYSHLSGNKCLVLFLALLMQGLPLSFMNTPGKNSYLPSLATNVKRLFKVEDSWCIRTLSLS